MAMTCMNEACKAATSLEWKRGWDLKSCGFATLCYSCGSAYENSHYCETFHIEESGWRECKFCSKRIHCGCIVSKNLYDYLDLGGVGCIGCSKKLENQPLGPMKAPNGDTPNRFDLHSANKVHDLQSSKAANEIDGFKFDFDKGKLVQLNKVIIENEKLLQLSKSMVENGAPKEQIEQGKEMFDRNTGAAKGFSDLLQQHVGPALVAKEDSARPELEAKSSAPPAHSVFRFSPGSTFRSPNIFAKEEMNKAASFQQGEKSGQILIKHSQTVSDSNKAMGSETRVPRPPAEGRGRSQLLPRYWPRISDQELQQISGDLNSTIVPLFEKVLSASDAGRIGRLVLPKACAEAYFPPISQSEGIPIKVQDIKGKEWRLQFRFWPNNNSRMYVLEGVAPCIQTMNLQAGDTVTFSRIDPGGKLVMGFRKSSNTGDMQDCQPSNVNGSGESSLPGVVENPPTDGGGTNEGTPHKYNAIPGKKKTRNIGSKNKRLHMHTVDAMELRLTRDEAQELLRPSPNAKPNIVMIEDQIFEEYEEPPVLGKPTIFTAGTSGNQDQWAQCDSCFKWRRLPVDFLVPPKWTCSENIWDSSRCSCSAIGEINPPALEYLLGNVKDFKKRKVVESPNAEQEHDASGLDALATAAFLGENTEGPGESSTGPTTRHPRHRPGCTCIVCIQPPSGKGKHKPTCICNVCLTVKRRFKTLMLKKKKRQVELALEKEKMKNDSGTNDTVGNGHQFNNLLEYEKSENKASVLDLNCDPNREEEFQRENGMIRPNVNHYAPLGKEHVSSTAGEEENKDERKDEQG